MTRSSLALLTLLPLFACADSRPATTDELAGETSADDGVDGKSDSPASDAYTYYEVRADLRKCAAPACGGYFLSRLNRSSTRCTDGSYQDSCYTPSLDWSEANLVDAQQQKLVEAANLDAMSQGVRAIARGWLTSHGFVVDEAWVAENATPSDGVFVKVRTNGIQCITAPCPTLTERGLNTTRYANISDLDWSDSGLSDHEISGFQSDFATSAVILAGWRTYIQDNGHWAKARTVTAAYHRLAN